MSLLDLIVKEYISIVELLEENEAIENDRIIIDKDYFKSLLEKYGYMKLIDKIKVYKSLNFIIHDKNNYTMPYRDREKKKTIRKVVINYHTYTMVKMLYCNELQK